MIKNSIKTVFFHFTNFNAAKDYYKTLAITNIATKSEIKKSFLKLAKQYHPDANKGNEEKFKEINEAYQVLSNDVQKKDYDDARRTTQGSFSQNGTSFRQSQGYSQTYNKSYGGSYQNTQQNTYRGYQSQQGWNNKKFREESIHKMYQEQQDRYTNQSYNENRAAQQQYEELLRKRASQSTNYQNRYEDDIESIIRKHAEEIKITREQVRKAEEEERRRREKEFQEYRDIRKEDLIKQAQDKAWKMAEGFKENVDGAIKVGKAIKDGMQDAIKVAKLAKNLWNEFKESKKK